MTAAVVERRRLGSGFSFWTLMTILALGIFGFLLLYPVLSLFINSLFSGVASDTPQHLASQLAKRWPERTGSES